MRVGGSAVDHTIGEEGWAVKKLKITTDRNDKVK
jgi:hypothetical protein